jgi:gluconokinase
MPAQPLILALDVGTSSARAALFNSRAERLISSTAQVPYALRVAPDGTAELDPGVLERAVVRAIQGALKARRGLRGNPPIAAVGMSCFWHSLLGENAGRPTPIYTWGDGRCQADADQLRQRLDERAYQARTGCLLRAPYWPAKLRWLRRIGETRAGEKWLSPSDWLYGRLAGAYASSLSMASGTGLLDGRRLCWDDAMLRICGVRKRDLPPLSDEPLHVTSDPVLPVFHRFPELKDVLWFPALGDGACGNLGSDAVGPHVAAVNLGTSGAVRVVHPKRPTRVPPGLFCYQIDARRALVGGANSNAGNLRAWALRELRLADDPRAIERALAARPGPIEGLTVLPFWAVERSPSWPEQLHGTITGLGFATTALDLLQAVTEAPYHRLAQIADELTGPRGGLDLIVSGGIRHSPESLQRLADVLGRPLRACAEPEASLRGAAVYVAERLGYRIAPLPAGKRYRPRKALAAAFAEARTAQIELERKLGHREMTQNKLLASVARRSTATFGIGYTPPCV